MIPKAQSKSVSLDLRGIFFTIQVFGKAIEGVTQVSNMLVTLNSSLNVFIYIIMGEKFKRAFLQILAGSGCHCMVKLMGGTNGAPENTVVTQSR